jgi:hypothetical protein
MCRRPETSAYQQIQSQRSPERGETVIDTTKLNQLWKDGGWRGALTILLGSSELSNDGRVWRHINLDRQEIHFSRILKDGTFSSGERILIEIAASLFNGDVKVNLWNAFGRLDDNNAKLAITAIGTFARLEVLESTFANRIIGKLNGHR